MILSIDDEQDVTDLIRFNLEKAGYDVITASSGAEALNTLAHLRPDLILLDLMLPDIDGFGVCEVLRRDPVTASIPIVILTAWATPDAQHLGLDLGAVEYLTKPFSPRELTARVQHLLGLRSDRAG